jgi:hypothetical protein
MSIPQLQYFASKFLDFLLPHLARREPGPLPMEYP